MLWENIPSGQPVFNVWLKACKASDERSAKNLTFLQKNLDIISIKHICGIHSNRNTGLQTEKKSFKSKCIVLNNIIKVQV